MYNNTSARRRGAILMGIVEFNHNPAKFYCPRMEREKRQNVGTSNIIGICASHWQGRPIFDLCQILLHSEMTPPLWWITVFYSTILILDTCSLSQIETGAALDTEDRDCETVRTVKRSRDHPKTIEVLTKSFYTSGPNFVIRWAVITLTNLKPRIGWNLTLK